MVNFRSVSPQKQYIIGQMALDNLSQKVIQFYIQVFDALSEKNLNVKQLALFTKYTTRTVRNYMARLEETGYVERVAYTEWSLTYPILRDCVFEKAAKRDEVHV